MFHHILAPVDFSPLSALGLRYAGALARCAGASIAVLFANPFLPPPYFTPARAAELERQFREGVREAETQLRAFTEAALGAESARATLRIVEALPVDAIIAAAEPGQTGLIVMGTHGRSGVNRIMLGSVAERVLRESRVPVLTVREGAPPEKVRSILVPVDGSRAALDALETARELARCTGAQVNELRLDEPGAEEAAERIVARAIEAPCDLLVIGARHRLFFDTTVLGATTARVVRHAPCPVLTVMEKIAYAARS